VSNSAIPGLYGQQVAIQRADVITSGLRAPLPDSVLGFCMNLSNSCRVFRLLHVNVGSPELPACADPPIDADVSQVGETPSEYR
jgi:hypothetical protein